MLWGWSGKKIRWDKPAYVFRYTYDRYLLTKISNALLKFASPESFLLYQILFFPLYNLIPKGYILSIRLFLL